MSGFQTKIRANGMDSAWQVSGPQVWATSHQLWSTSGIVASFFWAAGLLGILGRLFPSCLVTGLGLRPGLLSLRSAPRAGGSL